MSAVLRDLWPDDLQFDDVISPEEILELQAKRLTERSNGILVGHVERLAGTERVVLGFEVESPREEKRVRLFKAEHRKDFEYPVALQDPNADLPEFLCKRKYRPGDVEPYDDYFAGNDDDDYPAPPNAGAWYDDEWVADTPTEFSAKVEKLLAQSNLKGLLLSMITRTRRKDSATKP